MKTIATIIGIILFAIMFLGVGAQKYSYDKLDKAEIDLLMPPNERIYLYFQEYSHKYKVPLEFILRCAKLESNYYPSNEKYYPYDKNLISSAKAYSVLQVRIIAAKEVWPNLNKSNEEIAHMLRYDLRFNIETGIKYMRFIKDKGYSWLQTFSIYNQGWGGAENINSYARKIVNDQKL